LDGRTATHCRFLDRSRRWRRRIRARACGGACDRVYPCTQRIFVHRGCDSPHGRRDCMEGPRHGALRAGDTVLVLGTGGVSIFALQIAKAMGAIVIATSSSDEKLTRVRALGADHTINYRHDPDWGARVREWTRGSGVDHVIEVGGPGPLPNSITAVAIGGHIALIGVLTGRAGEIPTAHLMARQ